MATSSSGSDTPSTARPTTGSARSTGSSARSTTRRTRSSSASRTSSGSRTSSASRSRRSRSTSSSTRPRTRVGQVQEIAERAVLVPFGAGLIARDNVVASVKGITTKYRTRAGLEREIKRYERRGASARNRFERQVRRTRTKFERELRQRRTRLERSVRQNTKRVEREVKTVRRDLGKQSDAFGARVERLVANAQELINSAS